MVVLGIGGGKSELYACFLRPELKVVRQVVSNMVEGHACLQQWLEAHRIAAHETSVIMEATGVYWERIALKLHLAGYRVSVVNAAQIKFYAKSTLRRGKTDKMDAGAMVGRSRISKIGNSRLRKAFYLVAVTVSRLKNPMGEYYRRLVAAGKPKKVALIALARKILRTSFAVLRSGLPFDAGYQRPQVAS